MSGASRGIAGGAAILGAALALAWLSQAPYAVAGHRGAVVRLAWRLRWVRVEECRRLTAEELEKIPVHMRQEETCEARALPYRLRVELDGRAVVDETVASTGGRADRPLYVYHEVQVEPGDHQLDVVFARDLVPADTASERGEVGEREPPAPPRLALRQRMALERDRIALITYDPERRALVLKRSGSEGR